MTQQRKVRKQFFNLLWCFYQRLFVNSAKLVQIWFRCDRIWTQCLFSGCSCGGGSTQGAICWWAAGKGQQRPQYVSHCIVTLTYLEIKSRICPAQSCGSPAEPDSDEPTLIGGDIAIHSEADKNADPCTSNGCLWLKYTDGNVYIPYYIADHYCKLKLPQTSQLWHVQPLFMTPTDCCSV